MAKKKTVKKVTKKSVPKKTAKKKAKTVAKKAAKKATARSAKKRIAKKKAVQKNPPALDPFFATPEGLFSELALQLNESPGFHIANYFIRNSFDPKAPFLLRGVAEAEKKASALSDTFFSIDLANEIPKEYLDLLLGLSKKPKVSKLPPQLLFGLDASLSLPILLDQKHEWQTAKKASLLTLPLPLPGGELAGVLLLALIDSQPAYSSADTESILPFLPFLIGDAIFATKILSQRHLEKEKKKQIEKEKKKSVLAIEKLQEEHLQTNFQQEKKIKESALRFKQAEEQITTLKKALEQYKEDASKQEENHKKEREALADSFAKERQFLEKTFEEQKKDLLESFQKERLSFQESLQRQKESIQESKEGKQAAIEEASELRKQKTSLEAQLSKEEDEKRILQDRLREITAAKERLSELQARQDERQQELLEKNASLFEEQKQKLLQKNQELIEKIKEQEIEIKNIKAEKEHFEAQIAKFKTEQEEQVQEFEIKFSQSQKQIHQISSELQAKQKFLEEVQEERGELLKKESSLRKEKENLESQRHDLEKQLIQKEKYQQRQIENFDKKIQELEKSYQETVNRLKSEFTQEKEGILKEIELLRSEKQEIEREYFQAQSNYHNALYELQQKLKIQAESSERKLLEEKNKNSNLIKSCRDLQAQIENERKALESQKEILVKTREERQKEILSMEASLAASHEEIKKINASFLSLKQEYSILKKAKEDLSRELEQKEAKQSAALRELQNRHQKVLQEFNHKVQVLEDKLQVQTKRNLEFKDSLESLENEKTSLEKKLHDSAIESQSLQAKILELEKRLEQGNAVIEESRKTLEQKEELLLGRRKIIQKIEEEKKVLQQNFGLEQERTAVLERELQSLGQKLYHVETEVKSYLEEKKELQAKIVALKNEMQQKNSEILEETTKVAALKQELLRLEKNREGVLFEQKILEEALSEIIEKKDLEQKIVFLQKRFAAQGRVVLWSILGEGLLKLVHFESKEVELKAPLQKTWKLKSTLFGRILATGLAAPLPISKEAKDLDLPTTWLPEGSAPIQSSLCIPLSVHGRNNGVLLFSSEKPNAFGKENIALATKLAPLVALALDFEQRQASQERALQREELQAKVFRYLERRFLERNTYFHYWMQRSRSILQNKDSLQSLSSEMLDELSFPDTIPNLQPQELANSAQGFLNWLDLLQAQARSRGLELEQGISLEDIQRLFARLEKNSDYLYWYFEEAVRNVLEHAGAKRLSFQSRQTDSHFSLHVIDDGEGIVRTSGKERPMHKSGLPALQAMAELMDAKLSFGRGEKGYGLDLALWWRQ